MLSLIALVFNTVPTPFNANAVEAITDASDLLSDSDLGQTATHTFTFQTTTATPAGGNWYFDFPAGYDVTAAVIDCGYGAVAGTPTGDWGGTVECVFGSGMVATSTQVVMTGIVSTSTAGTYYIEVQNRDASDVALDRVSVATALISDVLVTARVDSSLTFRIDAVGNGTTVNGINCDQDSTATTVPFGLLSVMATSTVCQELNVTTNATDGYTVTVFQDNELTSASNDTINSFDNSPDTTGSTSAHVWVPPTNTIDYYHTYGHMGLTSDDEDLNSLGGYNSFAPADSDGLTQYAGLNSSDPMPVMHHDGPADEIYQNIGRAMVAYSIQIASLQEAGDYESTLTYIATPIF